MVIPKYAHMLTVYSFRKHGYKSDQNIFLNQIKINYVCVCVKD